MKKTLKIFVVLFIFAVLASALFACSKTEETVTVTFVTNGGMEVPSVTINVSDDLHAPTSVREGYTFIGWCLDNTLQIPLDGTPTGNLTVYAKWEANQNTLRFNANGANGEMSDITVATDATQTLPACILEKAGYGFLGWATTAEGEVVYADQASYTMGRESQYTLYAKWAANPNTLSFEANGGDGTMSDIVMATDATQTLPACTLEKADYIFVGWATTAEGEVVYTDQASYTMGPQSQYTLYAKWSATLNLYFDSNGGTGTMDAILVGVGQAFTIPQNAFSKNGYMFGGWATTEGGEAAYDDKGTMTAGTSDITLYAVWVDISTLVDLTHVEEGYILFGEYPQSVAAPEAVAAMGTAADANGYYTSAYDNAKYVKLTATPLHSDKYDSMFGDKTNHTIINEGEVYYFKVEPIKWRILAEDNGTYTLLAENIIDTLIFDDSSTYWHESQIRTWLNNDFFGAAFNDAQKTFVQNSNIITRYIEYNEEFDVDFETSDRIFLPSFADMTNVDYGFSLITNQETSSRQAITTEYSRAKGVVVSTLDKQNNNYDRHFGKGFYWTRSQRETYNLHRVQYIGSIEKTNQSVTGNGIRPMMVLVIP